jgi:hypothetical protein
MRALAFILCLALSAGAAMAAPFDGSDDYRSHFEFLGYSVEEGEKSLIAKHPEFYNVSIRPYNGGMLMITYFGTTDRAKSDRLGFLEFLNAMNTDAVAARYYEDDEGDVIVEAWYPGNYDRTRFGLFLDKFNLITDQLGDSDAASDYLE